MIWAMEISKELKKYPELQVRMGIHSGAKASRFGDGRYLVVERAEPVFFFLVRDCPTCDNWIVGLITKSCP